jgi:TRAP-type C4-dicarboxylate transport system permease small subunit
VDSGPFRLFAPVARAVAIASGWGLMAISVLTCIDIVGRKLFAFSFQGVDELSGYAMAIVSAAGFTYALGTRAHMRITLLFPYLPPLARSVLNVAALLTLAAMAVFCAVRGFAEVQASIGVGKGDWLDPAMWRRANTPLQMPLWIPQALWFAGLALFATVVTSCAVHAVGLLFCDHQRLDRLYGPHTLDEEIETELSLAEQRLAAERLVAERGA